jgi:uncharacterized membrane protein
MSRKTRGKPAPRPQVAAAPAKPRSPRELALIVLSAIGVLVTAYLSFGAVFGSLPAFCTEGSGCEIVQGSRYSRFLGVPVALWGLLTYGLLLGLSISRGHGLQRWQRLWSVAVAGLVVSLYLTAAGVIALQAYCTWCLVSLALILSIFVLVHLQRPHSAAPFVWGPWLGKHAIVLAAVLGLMQANAMGWLQPPEDPRLTALAKHLDASGAKFYGAFWCPNCQDQKDRFGPSQVHLPYVECSPRGRSGPVAFACVAENIGQYPTWIIRGQRYTSAMDTEELAKRSGFRWQADEATKSE